MATNPGPGEFDRVEDELDGIVCAHLAWLWHRRRSALHVYGSYAEGYIVAPPPPPPTHVALPPGLVFEQGRPWRTWNIVERPGPKFGNSSWRSAVRLALGTDLEFLGRQVEVELEFRLDPLTQAGRNEPDLDNLIKTTIDAFDGILGTRTWEGASQVDDVHVRRILAAKRFATPGEPAGAEVRVRLAVS